VQPPAAPKFSWMLATIGALASVPAALSVCLAVPLSYHSATLMRVTLPAYAQPVPMRFAPVVPMHGPASVASIEALCSKPSSRLKRNLSRERRLGGVSKDHSEPFRTSREVHELGRGCQCLRRRVIRTSSTFSRRSARHSAELGCSSRQTSGLVS
jgi:hypothetical protein